MKLVFTANEIIDRGVWDEFCQLRGYDVWCVNEGRMDSKLEHTLTAEEARILGLLPNRY